MNAEFLFRESLKTAGDPVLAEAQWQELKAYVSPPAAGDLSLRFLFSLLGNSPFLVHRILQSDKPTAVIDDLVFSPYLARPKEFGEMLSEILSILPKNSDLASAQRVLRAYKYREATRIAARDLMGGAPYEEIGRELAGLAQASAEAAVRFAQTQKPPKPEVPMPFVVLAMGKFGGEDLNFSSDIDLIYVHGGESHDDFEQSCRVSETVTRLLHDRTGDGLVFRVDLDLRPEGKSGVIVNSLDALTSYYEIAGHPWERAALTKARPVAGNLELGEETLLQLEPFIYPKHIDASAIDDLKRMKGKVNDELKKAEFKKLSGYHVKLGTGGIREIEFFVTAFQLIYGGKVPALRERNTLKALRHLSRMGLVPEDEAQRLQDAYVFLRRIENRLQMEDERQIHRLPTEPANLKALARRMGFPETSAFEKTLKEKTGFVAACFERLAS